MTLPVIEQIVLLDFIHRLVSQKIEAKSTIRSIPTHHRQNPTEITFCDVCLI
jgi:hypothetical protein